MDPISVPLEVGSKLPLPLYADVRLHIPMNHRIPNRYAVDEAAYFSTLFDVGGMIGSLGIGKLSDGLFKGKRVLMAAIMCWGTAMALVASNTVKEGDKVMEGVMLMLIGAMIGGPDSVLGGACTQDTCERAGASAAVLATACGITNGFGSVGAIAQGKCGSATYTV